MSKLRTLSRLSATQAKIAALRDDANKHEWLDAIVSMAALIARADGWVQDVERTQLLDFVDHYNLLSSFERDEVLEKFERRVRELRKPNGPFSAFQRLGRFTDRPIADLMLSVGSEIAAADCRLDPREEQLLRLFRTRLQGAMT